MFSKKLNFTFIQLRNFTKSEQELSSNFDDWLYCLKNLYHLTSRPKAVRGKVFAKMFKLMKIKQLNKEDMELYEKSVKEYDDILDAISFEGSKREAIGEARGIAIGETRGIAIGEARGIAIGETRGEERAKRTIVKSLLSKGFTLKDIEQLTGIPLDDLISICHK